MHIIVFFLFLSRIGIVADTILLSKYLMGVSHVGSGGTIHTYGFVVRNRYYLYYYTTVCITADWQNQGDGSTNITVLQSYPPTLLTAQAWLGG